MAVKGSGVSGDVRGQKDQTSSNIARDGAAKHPQTEFAVKRGMTDMVKELSGVGPKNPGVGPDASSANPLDPSPGMKELQTGGFKPSWGMRDGHGRGVDCEMAKKVLSEAANLGK